MPKITQEFDNASDFLFSEVNKESARLRALHPDDEYADDIPVVCVSHLRFVPCRECMYGTPADKPYAFDDYSVGSVRRYQQGD